MAFQYDINKIFAELEQQAQKKKKQRGKIDETKENDPIESPEDAPQTQEVAPATSKTTEDTHGGDEASKEIKDSPNSVDGGENPDKENKSKKTKNTGKQGQGDGQGDEEKKKTETSKDNGSKGDGVGKGDKQDTEKKDKKNQKKDEEKQEGDYFVTTDGKNPSKNRPKTTPEDLQKAVEELFEKKKKKQDDFKTQNRQEYLKKCLDSLINQTYKNIDIYIRDDGSKDETANIIKKYQNEHDNIHLEEGKNLGFIKSFFELLKNSDENADIYSYCDQDDIWEEDKIERAVKFINKEEKNIPILYFCNSDYYDINMNFIGHAEKNKVYNFRNSLVECVTQGMTMCINKKTRDLIVNNIPENTLFHDWWTYMICSGLGKVIYDEKSCVKYRRHNKSVTVEGKNFVELQIWRIKKFLIGNSLKTIKKQIIEYSKLYKEKSWRK